LQENQDDYKMVRSIIFDRTSNMEYCDIVGEKLEALDGLKKVNIFVGANNCGKSRMMRKIATDKTSQLLLDNNVSYTDSKYAKDFMKSVERLNAKLSDEQKIPFNVEPGYSTSDVYFEGKSAYAKAISLDNNISTPYHYEKSQVQSDFGRLKQSLTVHDYHRQRLTAYPIIYIPILRGIEKFDSYFDSLWVATDSSMNSLSMTEVQRKAIGKFQNNAKKVYMNKTKKVYEIDEKRIFTAENLYDEIVDKLLGIEQERQFVKEFESFLSDKFFNGSRIAITPIKSKGYLNIKIGDSPERALHNLGDGIKQLITIFYKIFEKRNDETIFLIEEPDINLHPGFQRQLLEILLSDAFPKHQYFITTHSNHLLDSCFGDRDVAIFSFQNMGEEGEKFRVIKTASGDISILDSLGVNNSSVFLANCTIWVEGLSDKILISKMLKMYLKNEGLDEKLKEDIHYSFVEYEGGNIVHWDFVGSDEAGDFSHALSITNRLFVICDNDNDGKQERKKALQKVFGDRYYEHEAREMENTVKLEVLEKTLFGSNEVKYKDGGELRRGEYDSKEKYLGEHIDETYELGRKYAGESGTIRDKIKFAKRLALNINTVEDLSAHNLDLCGKITDFIRQSNNLDKIA